MDDDDPFLHCAAIKNQKDGAQNKQARQAEKFDTSLASSSSQESQSSSRESQLIGVNIFGDEYDSEYGVHTRIPGDENPIAPKSNLSVEEYLKKYGISTDDISELSSKHLRKERPEDWIALQQYGHGLDEESLKNQKEDNDLRPNHDRADVDSPTSFSFIQTNLNEHQRRITSKRTRIRKSDGSYSYTTDGGLILPPKSSHRSSTTKINHEIREHQKLIRQHKPMSSTSRNSDSSIKSLMQTKFVLIDHKFESSCETDLRDITILRHCFEEDCLWRSMALVDRDRRQYGQSTNYESPRSDSSIASEDNPCPKINAQSERGQKAKFSAISLALQEEQRKAEYRRQQRILKNFQVTLPQQLRPGGSSNLSQSETETLNPPETDRSYGSSDDPDKPNNALGIWAPSTDNNSNNNSDSSSSGDGDGGGSSSTNLSTANTAMTTQSQNLPLPGSRFAQSMLGSNGGWTTPNAQNLDDQTQNSSWMSINLTDDPAKTRTIIAIITQGRGNAPQWVTRYTVSIKVAKKINGQYTMQWQNYGPFDANNDEQTMVSNNLSQDVHNAMNVKITPIACHMHCSMRAGLVVRRHNSEDVSTINNLNQASNSVLPSSGNAFISMNQLQNQSPLFPELIPMKTSTLSPSISSPQHSLYTPHTMVKDIAPSKINPLSSSSTEIESRTTPIVASSNKESRTTPIVASSNKEIGKGKNQNSRSSLTSTASKILHNKNTTNKNLDHTTISNQTHLLSSSDNDKPILPGGVNAEQMAPLVRQLELLFQTWSKTHEDQEHRKNEANKLVSGDQDGNSSTTSETETDYIPGGTPEIPLHQKKSIKVPNANTDGIYYDSESGENNTDDVSLLFNNETEDDNDDDDTSDDEDTMQISSLIETEKDVQRNWQKSAGIIIPDTKNKQRKLQTTGPIGPRGPSFKQATQFVPTFPATNLPSPLEKGGTTLEPPQGGKISTIARSPIPKSDPTNLVREGDEIPVIRGTMPSADKMKISKNVTNTGENTIEFNDTMVSKPEKNNPEKLDPIKKYPPKGETIQDRRGDVKQIIDENEIVNIDDRETNSNSFRWGPISSVLEGNTKNDKDDKRTAIYSFNKLPTQVQQDQNKLQKNQHYIPIIPANQVAKKHGNKQQSTGGASFSYEDEQPFEWAGAADSVHFDKLPPSVDGGAEETTYKEPIADPPATKGETGSAGGSPEISHNLSGGDNPHLGNGPGGFTGNGVDPQDTLHSSSSSFLQLKDDNLHPENFHEDEISYTDHADGPRADLVAKYDQTALESGVLDEGHIHEENESTKNLKWKRIGGKKKVGGSSGNFIPSGDELSKINNANSLKTTDDSERIISADHSFIKDFSAGSIDPMVKLGVSNDAKSTSVFLETSSDTQSTQSHQKTNPEQGLTSDGYPKTMLTKVLYNGAVQPSRTVAGKISNVTTDYVINPTIHALSIAKNDSVQALSRFVNNGTASADAKEVNQLLTDFNGQSSPTASERSEREKMESDLLKKTGYTLTQWQQWINHLAQQYNNQNGITNFNLSPAQIKQFNARQNLQNQLNSDALDLALKTMSNRRGKEEVDTIRLVGLPNGEQGATDVVWSKTRLDKVMHVNEGKDRLSQLDRELAKEYANLRFTAFESGDSLKLENALSAAKKLEKTLLKKNKLGDSASIVLDDPNISPNSDQSATVHLGTGAKDIILLKNNEIKKIIASDGSIVIDTNKDRKVWDNNEQLPFIDISKKKSNDKDDDDDDDTQSFSEQSRSRLYSEQVENNYNNKYTILQNAKPDLLPNGNYKLDQNGYPFIDGNTGKFFMNPNGLPPINLKTGHYFFDHTTGKPFIDPKIQNYFFEKDGNPPIDPKTNQRVFNPHTGLPFINPKTETFYFEENGEPPINPQTGRYFLNPKTHKPFINPISGIYFFDHLSNITTDPAGVPSDPATIVTSSPSTNYMEKTVGAKADKMSETVPPIDPSTGRYFLDPKTQFPFLDSFGKPYDGPGANIKVDYFNKYPPLSLSNLSNPFLYMNCGWWPIKEQDNRPVYIRDDEKPNGYQSILYWKNGRWLLETQGTERFFIKSDSKKPPESGWLESIVKDGSQRHLIPLQIKERR